MLAGHPQRITGPLPPKPQHSAMVAAALSVLKLRRFQLVASLAARCLAFSGAQPRREDAGSSAHQSYMTTKEIDDVGRALITVAQNLESDAAKQSMQEAFVQVNAYARATRTSAANRVAKIK